MTWAVTLKLTQAGTSPHRFACSPARHEADDGRSSKQAVKNRDGFGVFCDVGLCALGFDFTVEHTLCSGLAEAVVGHGDGGFL